MKEKNITVVLSPLEEEIMRAFWKIGSGEISDAIKEMTTTGIPYTTIASMVNKLENNHLLKKEGKRRGHIYRPTISERNYASQGIRHIVSQFFTGSYKDLVSFFAQEQKLSKDEIEEILDMIEKNNE